jgi:hypothetical protein
MHAIADFVGADYPESSFYRGAARLYERIASEDLGPGEKAVMDRFLGRS